MLKTSSVFLLALSLLSSCSWISKPQINSKGQIIAGSELEIKAQESTLTFEPAEILARPGQKIKIKLSNQMKEGPLNFLLLQQGDDPVVVAQLALQSSSEQNHWLPPQDYYIASKGPVLPQKSDKLSLTMPDTEGIYYFVSTYPRSSNILKGKFIVQKEPDLEAREEALDTSLMNGTAASSDL